MPSRGARRSLRGLGLNLARNPLIIALVLGALWHVLGVPLPACRA